MINEELQELISKKDKEYLSQLLYDIAGLSEENLSFILGRLKGTSKENIGSLAQDAKQKIREQFFDKSGGIIAEINLRVSRQIIASYSKLFLNHRYQITDLKLYFVETATEYATYKRRHTVVFFDSLIAIFDSFAKDITYDHSWYESFSRRVDKLVMEASQADTRYGEELGDLQYDLMIKLGLA